MFVLLLIAASCRKSENDSRFDDKPVIEGYLQAGMPVRVRISRQIASGAATPDASGHLDSLNVVLVRNGVPYAMYSAGDGVYCDSTLRVSAGEQYELHFDYNGKEVVAQTIVPTDPVSFRQSATSLGIVQLSASSGPPSSGGFPEPVKLTWRNDDGSYYVAVVRNVASNPQAIRDTTSGSRPPATVFRNRPTTGNTYEITPQTFEYFGMHQILLYHINADYAALYNDDDNTSQNLTNPSTSIQNGLGIFTGLGVDTLWLNVYKK
jgi:hypothetical protein